MTRILMANVATVWCGAMARRGKPGSGQNAGTHMRGCPDCRRVRAAYWAAIRAQSAEGEGYKALVRSEIRGLPVA